MKKLIIALTLIILLTGCNTAAKHFGGTVNIDLPEGEKLVDVTWKEHSLWYLTKPMAEDDIAETYIYREDSNFGLIEGTVIFKESR